MGGRQPLGMVVLSLCLPLLPGQAESVPCVQINGTLMGRQVRARLCSRMPSRVTWGGGPPGPSRSRRGVVLTPGWVLRLRVWKVGALPGLSSRPPCGDPCGGWVSVAACSGVSKPACWGSGPRRLLKAPRGPPGCSPARGPQPRASANPPAGPRANPGSGIRMPLSARQRALWIKHIYLHF